MTVNDDYLDLFRAAVVAEALLSAQATYWKRRAATFDAVGTPTADEIAQACRNHAAFLEQGH